MATRALIGYFDDDRVLTTTYNHYDGYPDHLGKMLNKYFSNEELAKKIAGTGYISYIDDDGNIESKNKRNPDKIELGRDVARGATLDWEDALLEMAKEIDNYGADYAYIWYEGDGDWSVIKNTGIRSMIDQLADELASAATMYGPVDEDRKVFDYNKLTRKQIEDLEDLKLKKLKKENMDYKLDPYDDKEEVEGMIIKLVVGKRGVSKDIAKSFIDTHYEDIIKMSDTDDILDEFDEFFSVNYETGADYMDEAIFTANEMGDKAVEDESASGAFEEAVNWRGETLKEQFKRLSK